MKNKNRSAARKAAKESGNFVACWRPRATAYRDRKKEGDKRACRGTPKEILNDYKNLRSPMIFRLVWKLTVTRSYVLLWATTALDGRAI
jgi:hypothetical protein